MTHSLAQVTWPPPYGGYDYNWALFGLGEDAANKTFIGSVFEECVSVPLVCTRKVSYTLQCHGAPSCSLVACICNVCVCMHAARHELISSG